MVEVELRGSGVRRRWRAALLVLLLVGLLGAGLAPAAGATSRAPGKGVATPAHNQRHATTPVRVEARAASLTSLAVLVALLVVGLATTVGPWLRPTRERTPLGLPARSGVRWRGPPAV